MATESRSAMRVTAPVPSPLFSGLIGLLQGRLGDDAAILRADDAVVVVLPVHSLGHCYHVHLTPCLDAGRVTFTVGLAGQAGARCSDALGAVQQVICGACRAHAYPPPAAP